MVGYSLSRIEDLIKWNLILYGRIESYGLRLKDTPHFFRLLYPIFIIF